METQTATQPKKRSVRKRRLDLQLERALRDAEAATGADAPTKYLIQTRLNILSQQLAREQNDKLKRAQQQLEATKAENERLRTELAKSRSVPLDEQASRDLNEQAAAMLRRIQTGQA